MRIWNLMHGTVGADYTVFIIKSVCWHTPSALRCQETYENRFQLYILSIYQYQKLHGPGPSRPPPILSKIPKILVFSHLGKVERTIYVPNVADFEEIPIPLYKWIYKTLMKTSYFPWSQVIKSLLSHTIKVWRQSSRICCMKIITIKKKKFFQKNVHNWRTQKFS